MQVLSHSTEVQIRSVPPCLPGPMEPSATHVLTPATATNPPAWRGSRSGAGTSRSFFSTSTAKRCLRAFSRKQRTSCIRRLRSAPFKVGHTPHWRHGGQSAADAHCARHMLIPRAHSRQASTIQDRRGGVGRIRHGNRAVGRGEGRGLPDRARSELCRCQIRSQAFYCGSALHTCSISKSPTSPG